MGGKPKSKFTFPKPGWSSRKKDADKPPAISSPLTKAQRILGADGINTSTLRVDVNRAWETASNGGMSVSISESSASQSTNDTGFDKADGDDSVGTSYGKTGWEAESGIIPRQLWSSHGPPADRLAPQRSAWTIGGDSTDVSTRGMRMSTSTMDTHYDSAKMPLAISQQTSNSAMAKGLPSKINALLDIDGTLAGPILKKKNKPAKLDFSRLRPKAFKDRSHGEAVLGNNYVMKSPSFMSTSSPSDHSAKKSTRRLAKKGSQTFVDATPLHSPQPPGSRSISDSSGLHQLYNHYEQASFRDEFELDEEEGYELRREQEQRSVLPETGNGPSHPQRSHNGPLTSAPIHQQGHTRDASYDSRMSPSRAAGALAVQDESHLRLGSAGSGASHRTHKSKASMSSRSIPDAQRFQHSVLSLSDSSDEDEALESFPVPPSGRSGDPDPHHAMPEHQNVESSQSNPSQSNGMRKYTPSLDQVNEDLAINAIPTFLKSRSPSSNAMHSSQSSVSTVTPHRFLPRSAADSRASIRSNDTMDTVVGIQEAKAISYVPLASTAEAASRVPLSNSSYQNFSNKVTRNNSSRSQMSQMSRVSHSSDQPTPPLSPTSVVFYMKSRESLARDASGSNATETNKARLMAVTKQEEMLLAALRIKRAKMHESLASDGTESSRSSIASGQKSSSAGDSSKEASSQSRTLHSARTSSNWPGRSSSLFISSSRESLTPDNRSSFENIKLDAEQLSATSGSNAVEVNRYSSAAASTNTTGTSDSRNGKLPRSPHKRSKETSSVSTPEESAADFSDCMGDSDGEDLVVNERRTSRMQAKRESLTPGLILNTHRQSNGSHRSPLQRDYVPISSLSSPASRHKLHDVPEIEVDVGEEFDEDIDADENDDEGLEDISNTPPPMPPPSGPLPSPPQKSPTKPTTPRATHFLHPSSARNRPSPKQKQGHIKSKRSMVRLSAVGLMHTPPSHWNDD